MKHKSVIFCLLLTLPLSASAAIYKWVDDQGNTHYDQEKPLDTAAEKIKVQSSPAGASTYKKPSLKTKAENTTGADEDTAGKQSKEILPKKQRAELCKRAQDTLKKLSEGGRVRTKNQDGSTQVMTEEQKQERIKQEQLAVKQHCS